MVHFVLGMEKFRSNHQDGLRSCKRSLGHDIIISLGNKYDIIILEQHSSSTASFRFSAILLPQQPLHGGCCFYHLGLFIEYFYYLLPCAALREAWLVYIFFGIMMKSLPTSVYVFVCTVFHV
jgi:hypothetical protein